MWKPFSRTNLFWTSQSRVLTQQRVFGAWCDNCAGTSKQNVMNMSQVEANFLFLLNFYATFATGIPCLLDFQVESLHVQKLTRHDQPFGRQSTMTWLYIMGSMHQRPRRESSRTDGLDLCFLWMSAVIIPRGLGTDASWTDQGSVCPWDDIGVPVGFKQERMVLLFFLKGCCFDLNWRRKKIQILKDVIHKVLKGLWFVQAPSSNTLSNLRQLKPIVKMFPLLCRSPWWRWWSCSCATSGGDGGCCWGVWVG